MKKQIMWLSLLSAAALFCALSACTPKTPDSSDAESAESRVTTAAAETAADQADSAEPTNGGEETTAPANSSAVSAAATTTKAQSGNSTQGGNVWGSRPRGTTAANVPKVIDMKGKTLTLGTKWITDWGNGDPGDSVIGDKWIAWRKNFEKTFNCKLKNLYVDPYMLFSSLSTKLMSGDYVADVITMQLFDVEAFRHAGLLQPLQSVPNLNLEHPAVQQQMVDNFTFGKNSYLYAYGLSSEVNGIYVNRDMVKELKLDDPFTLANSKKWTYSVMDQMAQKAYKDLNHNNKIDSADRFGMSIGPDYTLGTLRVSGVKIITYQNGTFSYTFNNAKTLKYLGAIKDSIKAGGRVYTGNDAMEKFVKGELLFMAGASGIMASEKCKLWDADFDIGYLPCTPHEAGTTYTNSCSTWLGGLAIPKNTKQLTEIAYLINAATEMTYSLQSESEKAMKKYMDKDSFALFMKYNTKYTVDAYCWQNQFKDLVKQKMDDTLFDTAVTPAKYLESIDSAMKNAVKDYYSKDPDLIE